MPRLLIVSNRLPLTVNATAQGPSVTRSTGGLASGLKGVHERMEGLWFGWPGDVSGLNAAQLAELEAQLAAVRTVPLYLSQEDINQYYEGFSNGVLWPLFHYQLDRIPQTTQHWDAYRVVNARFAALVAHHYQPGDLIWVHDYQLCLVPQMLRQLLPDARIGFFLHIPWPTSEIFRTLPWRCALLHGLLGADVIGFHAFSYVRHFGSCVLRLLGTDVDVDRLRHEGRDVLLTTFPMGVDAAAFDALSRDEAVVRERDTLRAQAASGEKLLVGIDRLDYTKGIPHRLLAVERLLERAEDLRGQLRLIQVAVPSRQNVPAYDEFRRGVDELVGRINGGYGTACWTPIHYLYRSLSEQQVAALYQAADVMVVTPLRDGMNLVAKEFVASRRDEDGVLVLSEFAGAAAELGEALHVNPFDVDGVADTIARALRMPPRERRARMRALRRRVFDNDIHGWCSSFIDLLQRRPAVVARMETQLSSPSQVEAVVMQLRHAPSRLLLLDYDGTLVPFASMPELAAPDAELLELLTRLAAVPETHVHVVSGRKRESLEGWLGTLPVGLHAEHGFWSRLEPHGLWTCMNPTPQKWMDKVLAMFKEFASRTPGSLIEVKSMSATWHYRMTDPDLGAVRARELRFKLNELLATEPAEILQGNHVVEVRLNGVHKGAVVRQVMAQGPLPQAILAMGDDTTDEDLFAALPPDALTVHVGPQPSQARYRLASHTQARAMLRALTTR